MSYIQELRALVGHRPLILVGAVVMIFDEHQRLLLQHRNEDNLWDLPGGFMEVGETTEETARREIQEETGLEIGKMTLFKVCSGKDFIYECPNGDQVVSVALVYMTNDVRGKLRADGSEGSEVSFFPIDRLPDEMLPQVRQIIQDFLDLRTGWKNFQDENILSK
jgi:ADP-ribose pyrophosphatase YjhB (NUDIX family)